ncbi:MULTISPECIES: hypothetical protein [Pseudomonas]|uniref:Uncharacterized protein n=1 Tax=Pseudomonas chlororaphis TaxID=587753 RepID=A0A0D5Y0B5_9PSED|nr:MULTISPECIES: hypothetical protein [Pseudomonas]AJO78567.1 hypothetical protein TO66_15155 [Pseudomonas sp. MRSN 12121]AKA24505.1 hypothetical protein PCL1606_30540 [Pseudomonas chlororaphis]
MRDLNAVEIEEVSGAGLTIGGVKVVPGADLSGVIKNNTGSNPGNGVGIGIGIGSEGKNGVGIQVTTGWAGWPFN